MKKSDGMSLNFWSMAAVNKLPNSETEKTDENNSPVLVYTAKVREVATRYCQRITRLFEETFYNKPGPLDQQYVSSSCSFTFILFIFIY